MTTHPAIRRSPAAIEPASHLSTGTAAGAPRTQAILLTGAGGEVGHGLIHRLSEAGGLPIVALDLRPLDDDLARRCHAVFTGDIRDPFALAPILARYELTEVYHLAALLSSTGERNPELAHEVNTQGTMNLLRLCAQQAQATGRPVKFIYPSSIAAYGLPSEAEKRRAGAVLEDQYLNPITMYGVNKLCCEHLGRYYAEHYKLLDRGDAPAPIDFRCVRYPGLISPHTAPSGGTSDYGPLMLHAAAKGQEAVCFVEESAQLPFMLMADAIDATLALARADRVGQRVYNVASFAPTAGEIASAIARHYPGFKPRYEIHPGRAAIVSSWPADVDRSAAHEDLGVATHREFAAVLADELVPAVRSMYG
ncbi:MAG: NAD-dependent epimerase/dehydratase family protein [Phycisphaerales bacterium JB064]